MNLEHGWLLPQREDEESERYCRCALCSGDINYGDEYYEILDTIMCKECVNDGRTVAR